MTTATECLRRAAAAMRSGQPVPSDIARSLANAIDDAVNNGGGLDEALGLERSPTSSASLSRRADLIAKVGQHYTGSPSGRAKAIAADARDYASRCWPRLRDATAAPAYHRNGPEMMLFDLHREAESGGAAWPVGWRTILESLQRTGLRLQTIRPHTGGNTSISGEE